MPVDTRRSRLPAVAPSACEHPGLWLERYLPALPKKSEKVERSPQAEHIAAAAQIAEPRAYRPAFARWSEALLAAGAALREGEVQGRMVVGLGDESVLETAVTIHHTYGVPYIPGSALKGLAAAYARRFLAGEWAAGGSAYRTVFGAGGHSGAAGYLTFHDALYIPGTGRGRSPLEPDVLTVHHQEYYNKGGRAAPADWDSPNPVAFLSVTGSYLLALSGPSEAWIERAFELLAAALGELGVGAKTSSGYGRLSVRPYRGLSAASGRAAPASRSGAQGSSPPPAEPGRASEREPEREAPEQPPAPPAELKPLVEGAEVTGQRKGELRSAFGRGVRVNLNLGGFAVPKGKTVVGLLPQKLAAGSVSGGFRGRVTRLEEDGPTLYVILEPKGKS